MSARQREVEHQNRCRRCHHTCKNISLANGGGRGGILGGLGGRAAGRLTCDTASGTCRTESSSESRATIADLIYRAGVGMGPCSRVRKHAKATRACRKMASREGTHERQCIHLFPRSGSDRASRPLRTIQPSALASWVPRGLATLPLTSSLPFPPMSISGPQTQRSHNQLETQQVSSEPTGTASVEAPREHPSRTCRPQKRVTQM